MGYKKHKVESRRTRTSVIDRRVALCDYFNSMKSGNCTKMDEEILSDLPAYKNRKTLYRDIQALQDNNYITVDVEIYTPVSIANGTAKQFIRKNRAISFRPSQHGLLALPTKTMPGDLLGKSIYQGETIYYYSEVKQQSKWVVGWDDTLVLNKDYIA